MEIDVYFQYIYRGTESTFRKRDNISSFRCMHPRCFPWSPITAGFYVYFYPAGLILTVAVGFGFVVLIYKSRAKLTPGLRVELSLVSVLLMPFFLPEMHERYFYPADILSILFAFYFPSYFYIPIGMSVISFFAYQPTLFNVEPVPIGVLAIAVLAIIVILTRDMISRLYAQDTDETPTSPGASSSPAPATLI